MPRQKTRATSAERRLNCQTYRQKGAQAVGFVQPCIDRRQLMYGLRERVNNDIVTPSSGKTVSIRLRETMRPVIRANYSCSPRQSVIA